MPLPMPLDFSKLTLSWLSYPLSANNTLIYSWLSIADNAASKCLISLKLAGVTSTDSIYPSVVSVVTKFL